VRGRVSLATADALATGLRPSRLFLTIMSAAGVGLALFEAHTDRRNRGQSTCPQPPRHPRTPFRRHSRADALAPPRPSPPLRCSSVGTDLEVQVRNPSRIPPSANQPVLASHGAGITHLRVGGDIGGRAGCSLLPRHPAPTRWWPTGYGSAHPAGVCASSSAKTSRSFASCSLDRLDEAR
jgi:hypothetical protein